MTASAPSSAAITESSSAAAGGDRISGHIVRPRPTAISAYMHRSSYSRRVAISLVIEFAPVVGVNAMVSRNRTRHPVPSVAMTIGRVDGVQPEQPSGGRATATAFRGTDGRGPCWPMFRGQEQQAPPERGLLQRRN